MTFALSITHLTEKISRSPAIFSIAGALAQQGFALLVFMLLARMLTVEMMGIWAIWLTLLTVADMSRQGFIQNGLVRFSAAEPAAWGGWLRAAFFLNGLAAGAMGLLLAGAALLAAHLLRMPVLQSLAAWALPFVLLQSTARFGEAMQVAVQDFRGIFWANVLNGCLQLALVGSFFLQNIPPTLLQLMLIQAAGIASALIFTCFFCKKHICWALLEKKKVWALFHFGKFAAGTNFMSLLFQRLDTLLVGAFLTPAAVGIYNTATRLNGLADLPLNSLSLAQFPKLAKASGQQAHLRAATQSCIRQLVFVQAPTAVLLAVLAPQAVCLLAGESYGSAAPLLQMLALAGLVKPWGRTFGMTLDAIGKPRLNFYMLLFSMAVNVSLLLALVPCLEATGAALAMGLGVVLTTLAGQVILKRTIMGKHTQATDLQGHPLILEEQHIAITTQPGETLPLVSIITVNYRQAAVTCELLDSIQKLAYPQLETIVVDNGCLEDCTELFERRLPGVQVINSERNLGFAGGNNLGIRQAKGEFIFLINNDTEVADGLIESLVARCSQPGVGTVSPKIRYFHQPAFIQYAGFTQINPLTGRNTAIGQGETDCGQHDTARPTPYAHGAALLLHRQAVEKAGPMPEEYFLYYEELDWCEQIRRAGYEIWYEPAALIFHKESVSTGKESPLKTEYLTRNRLRFMRRNFGAGQYRFFLIYFFTVTAPLSSLRLLLAGKLPNLLAFWRGALA